VLVVFKTDGTFWIDLRVDVDALALGVEAGQLAVVGAAFLLIGWFSTRSWYRRRVTIPLSGAIAVVGLYWAVTRAVFGA
jgi:hypothetical protein